MALLRFGAREHTPKALEQIMQPSVDPDDILRQRGIMEALFTFDEYFDVSYMPLVKGEARDKMYIEKLRKIKERYFDPI